MKKIVFSLSIIAFTLMTLSSCVKPSANNTPTALIGLHIHTSIDSAQLDPVLYNAYYPDSTGRMIKLDIAQFYLTNVSLRNSATQQWYVIPNSIILKRIQNELYVIGNVPAGTYDDLRFTIGLNNALNSAAPSSYSSTSGADTVLSSIEQSMMWGSGMAGMTGAASGYTFMNVQGYDSTDHIAFSYQLGGFGDTVLTTMQPSVFTLSANQPQVVQYLHIICDYGKLLQNIDLANPANATGSFYSTTPQSVTNAANMLNSIPKMFRYECTTPNGDC